MKPGSLHRRLLLAAAASISVALLLSAIGLARLFQQHVERRVEAELATHLEQILAAVDRSTDGRLRLSRQAADPRFNAAFSGLYWQLESGEQVLRSRSLWDQRLQLPPSTDAIGVHRHRIAGPNGAELLALARSVTLPERLGGEPLRAVAALDMAEIRSARREFFSDLLPYLSLIGALLLIAAWAQVKVGLAPLKLVRNRLAAVSAGQTRRLGTPFPDEVLPLARQVDALLEQQERELERARQRAADLAHGLKTPLQVLAGDVASLRQRGVDEVADEIEEVTRLMLRHIDRELARARLAARRSEAAVLAPAAALARRLVAVVSRSPDGARLAWRIDIPDSLQLRIDPDDLTEALGNLLENAARHARTTVKLRAEIQGEDGRIVVADDGPGIPTEQLEAVQARGVRLDTRSSGSGLGLAIAREIIEAWSGSLELHSTPSGLEAALRIRRGSPGS